MAEIYQNIYLLITVAFVLVCVFVFFIALQLKKATIKIAATVHGDMVMLLSQNKMLVEHINQLLIR